MVSHAQIIRIDSSKIDTSLIDSTRQYLVGDLKRPQVLNHIHSEKLEIGITRYSNRKIEQPHYHQIVFEYHYVVSGKTAYLDIRSGEEFIFKEGDFYLIEPGVIYAQKSTGGFSMLFVKIPAGNDKVVVAMPEKYKKWFNKPI